jgi:hypothetical protein
MQPGDEQYTFSASSYEALSLNWYLPFSILRSGTEDRTTHPTLSIQFVGIQGDWTHPDIASHTVVRWSTIKFPIDCLSTAQLRSYLDLTVQRNKMSSIASYNAPGAILVLVVSPQS